MSKPSFTVTQESFETFTKELQNYVSGIQNLMAPLKSIGALESSVVKAFQVFQQGLIPIVEEAPEAPLPAAPAQALAS